jgi:DNA-binding GntR family transcriptional regulator
LLPSLRRLLIDHARIGRVFYQHPGTVAMQHDMQTALQQHDEIIAAIERRDSEAAGDIVSAHFELSRRNMKLYAVPDGLTVPETQQ